MTDLKRFMELLAVIRIYMEGFKEESLKEIEVLFKKHYSISEDEILKLAQGILIKREKK